MLVIQLIYNNCVLIIQLIMILKKLVHFHIIVIIKNALIIG